MIATEHGQGGGGRGAERWLGLSMEGASLGHEKHVFGGAPLVNGRSVPWRFWHSLGLKDERNEEGKKKRKNTGHIPLGWLLQVNGFGDMQIHIS